MAEGPPPEHVFRALVTTDNHLGYCGKDGTRKDDSFETFEEILKLAVELDVDCILHSGDLFHKNQPSRKTMVRTVELLRKYCLGDEPVPLELLSEHQVNYLDPNINVSIPVFAVHGNHDDPSGEGGFSAMDVLSKSGLLNYVGKTTQLDQLRLAPVILKKGDTQVCIYGMGHVRDERLYRLLGEQKVNWLKPADESFEAFNVLLIHQNRVAHSTKNFVHELMLPEFLDFVIWGHEHECLIQPTQVAGRKFFVTQPGSSVATSLIEGETKKKHVALLEVYKEQFNLTPLPLQTVRPFIMRDVELRESDLGVADEEGISAFLADVVEQMLIDVEDEVTPEQKDMLPLIRIRVNLAGGYERFSAQRFGVQFSDRVANPSTILHFLRVKSGKRGAAGGRSAQQLLADMAEVGGENARNTVEAEVRRILEGTSMLALPRFELGEALRSFVDKEQKGALKAVIKRCAKDAKKHVLKMAREEEIHDLDDTAIQQLLADYVRDQDAANDQLGNQDLGALLGDDGEEEEEEEEEEDSSNDMEDDELVVDVKPARKKKKSQPATAKRRGQLQIVQTRKKKPTTKKKEAPPTQVAVKRERQSTRQSTRRTTRTSARKTRQQVSSDEEENDEDAFLFQDEDGDEFVVGAGADGDDDEDEFDLGESSSSEIVVKKAPSRRKATTVKKQAPAKRKKKAPKTKKRVSDKDLDADVDFGAIVRNRKKK